MKAIVYKKQGLLDVLQFKEVAELISEDNEVLIREHAMTVIPIDRHFR